MIVYSSSIDGYRIAPPDTNWSTNKVAFLILTAHDQILLEPVGKIGVTPFIENAFDKSIFFIPRVLLQY